MRINVTYAVNQLAGTGAIKMEKQSAIIQVESNISDEEAVTKEVMEKLSKLETLPKNEIKILSFSEL